MDVSAILPHQSTILWYFGLIVALDQGVVGEHHSLDKTMGKTHKHKIVVLNMWWSIHCRFWLRKHIICKHYKNIELCKSKVCMCDEHLLKKGLSQIKLKLKTPSEKCQNGKGGEDLYQDIMLAHRYPGKGGHRSGLWS